MTTNSQVEVKNKRIQNLFKNLKKILKVFFIQLES